MTEIKLYSAAVCPFAQRTRILLLEKGIKFELVEIDLGNKPDWFSDISPFGKVPLLEHQGQYIYESSVINEYLEDTFPAPSLTPKMPVGKAFMRIWIEFMNNRFISNYYGLLKEQDSQKQNELQEKVYQDLDFLETQGFAKLSANGPYLFGEHITLADISMYPFFERFVVAEHYRSTSIPAKCERLLRWLDAMKARDSVKATANSKDFFIEKYKKYAEGA